MNGHTNDNGAVAGHDVLTRGTGTKLANCAINTDTLVSVNGDRTTEHGIHLRMAVRPEDVRTRMAR